MERGERAGATVGGDATRTRGASSTEAFLVVVGERVRRQRSLVHMPRRLLAERSGVSERYLAQLETGQGNMSIVLLRKVAFALELPLAELVAEDASGTASGSARPVRPSGAALPES